MVLIGILMVIVGFALKLDSIAVIIIFNIQKYPLAIN